MHFILALMRKNHPGFKFIEEVIFFLRLPAVNKLKANSSMAQG